MKTTIAGRLGVRGRVWLDRRTAPFRTGRSRGVAIWAYEVQWRGDVIFTDYGTDYDKIQAQCRRDIEALCRILHTGYRLRPENWNSLPDGGPEVAGGQLADRRRQIPDLHKPGTDWDAPKVTVTGHLVGMHTAGTRKGWVWVDLTPKGQLDTPLPLDHPCHIPEEESK